MPAKGTIAVIDDEPALREATSSVLQSAGFATTLYASAEAFLRAPDDATTTCLVLDITLPGMTGLELQRHLADCGRAIPIVFVTARHDVDGGLEARARGHGARGFLRKPFVDSDLLQAVEIALHGTH